MNVKQASTSNGTADASLSRALSSFLSFDQDKQSDLLEVLHRALRTWEQPPAWLVRLHDALTGVPTPVGRQDALAIDGTMPGAVLEHRSHGVPQGFKLLPLKQTPEMEDAFAGALEGACGCFFEWARGGDAAYQALLDAAPMAEASPIPLPGIGSEVVNDACWKFFEGMPHSEYLSSAMWGGPLKKAIYEALKLYHGKVLEASAAQGAGQAMGDQIAGRLDAVAGHCALFMIEMVEGQEPRLTVNNWHLHSDTISECPHADILECLAAMTKRKADELRAALAANKEQNGGAA